MRELFSVLLCITMLTPTWAQAEAARSHSFDTFTIQREAGAYGTHRRRVREPRINRPADVAPASNSSKLEMLGHQVQALLLMMIVSGVEIVRQEIKMANLKESEVDAAKVAELAGKASDQILFGTTTWASLMGAGAAGFVAKKPFQFIHGLIADSVSRPLFRSLLQSGIVSLITFTAWEVGAQIWDEARELIEDEADYQRAEQLGAVLLGSLFALGSQDPINANDMRILGLMASKIFTVLVNDNDRRDLALYNAWRLKIATGGFVTLISSMVAAGAVGTAFFPGAGTFVFGLAGGALSLLIPDEANHAISNRFAEARIKYNVSQSASELKTLANLDSLPVFEIKDVLSNLSKYRDAAMTARFEVLYRYYSRANVLKGNRDVALQSNNTEAASKLDHEIQKNVVRTARLTAAIGAAMDKQVIKLGAAAGQSKKSKKIELIQNEIDRLSHLASIIKQMGPGLTDPNVPSELKRASELLLNKIYSLGFRGEYFEVAVRGTPESA